MSNSKDRKARQRGKALRWALWHTPARIVHRSRRHIIRILDDWPTTPAILGAYQRIALIT